MDAIINEINKVAFHLLLVNPEWEVRVLTDSSLRLCTHSNAGSVQDSDTHTQIRSILDAHRENMKQDLSLTYRASVIDGQYDLVISISNWPLIHYR